jgi:hypothetical protein
MNSPKYEIENPQSELRGQTRNHVRCGGWFREARLALLVLVLGFAPSAFCQNYSITWSTLDGGGGTSTGGVYSVTGTVGQPDAGTMSGGNFALTGGFWSLLAAVQTPGAPLLRIALTTTNTALVTWPSPSTGWTLQQNTNSVSSVNWSNVISGVADNGATKTLLVSPLTGSRFYRLTQ